MKIVNEKDLVCGEFYFTAAHGYDKSVAENFHINPYPLATPVQLEKITFCVLTLRDGGPVTGISIHDGDIVDYDFDTQCAIAHNTAMEILQKSNL